MPRCNYCGLTLTLVMDHIRKITYYYCPVCDLRHNDGLEAGDD